MPRRTNNRIFPLNTLAVKDGRAQRQGYKVLVVDDHVSCANALAALFYQFGNEVCTAYSGYGALELMPSFQPDVLLLDIDMPGLDGYQTAQRIRAQTQWSQPSIFALTGSVLREGTQIAHARSREAGMNRHFTKPVDVIILQGIIETHVEQSRKASAI